MYAFCDCVGNFDENRLRALDRAFADACRDVGIDPQPSYADTARARKTRSVIASAVRDAAMDGELDAGILKWVAFRKCQSAFRS